MYNYKSYKRAWCASLRFINITFLYLATSHNAFALDSSSGSTSGNTPVTANVGIGLFFHIKNKWHGEYLYDGGEQLQYSVQTPDPNDTAYQWSLEAREGVYNTLRNRKTKDTINIEKLQDYVGSDASCPPQVGDSCKWALETAGNGFIRLRNGWHLGDYLHVQDQKGYVQHGMMYPIWDSAQWQFVSPGGAVNTLNDYYQIKNRWNSACLYDDGIQLKYGSSHPGADPAYQWIFEPRENGYYDIKNRSTGDYINIENLQDFVQSDAAKKPKTWDSSKWAIEGTPDGYARLRNGWHQGDYMHVQDLKGYVQHGMMYPVWESAQWQLIKATSTMYTFQAEVNNKCLTVGGGENDASQVKLASGCTMANNDQVWLLESTNEPGTYRMVSISTKDCMEAGSTTIKTAYCDENAAGQKWKINRINTGNDAKKLYRLMSVSTNQCLAVPTAGGVDVQNNVQLANCSNGREQLFKATKGNGVFSSSNTETFPVPDTTSSSGGTSGTDTASSSSSGTTSSTSSSGTPDSTSSSGSTDSSSGTVTPPDSSSGSTAPGSSTSGSTSTSSSGTPSGSEGTSGASSSGSPEPSDTTTNPNPATITQCSGKTVASSSIPLPAGRGASVPWTEYQAEDTETNGQILGQDARTNRIKWDANHIEAEAIGRKAVRLSKDKDFICFKPVKAGNGIVVRYSIPDTPQGGRVQVNEATLGIYVNDVRVATLPLTSKYSWSYGGELLDDPRMDVPGAQPHTFFDEVHIKLDKEVPGNANFKIMLDKSIDKSTDFYVLDLVDIESVPGEVQMPAGFTSITDPSLGFNIKPNDGLDHADDILEAMTKTKKLWFPAGTYRADKFVRHSQNVGIDNSGTEVRGAGMWYTNLIGSKAMFFCNGPDTRCVYRDLFIGGNSTARTEGGEKSEGPQKAFAGPQGTNSLIENVWIEHFVVGVWSGNDPAYQPRPTEKLTIRNCRIRNVFADAINLANGTSNTTIENCHMRNTGDDAVAIWSVKWKDWVADKSVSNEVMKKFFETPDGLGNIPKNYNDQGQAHGNHVHNVTVQMPWRANCFALYGGTNNLFENNVCEDVLTYPGILIDREFSSYPFKDVNGGTAVNTFRNISLIRAGGSMFAESTGHPEQHGALKFAQCEGDVTDIVVDHLDIISPTYAGIEFRGFGTGCLSSGTKLSDRVLTEGKNAKFENITIKNVTIKNAGTYGIEVQYDGGKGKVNFENVSVSGSATGAIDKGGAPDTFFNKLEGNSGW